MDEHVRGCTDEPAPALPGLIMPSTGRVQTPHARISVFSVSWSCVFVVLALAEGVFGLHLTAGVLPGVCSALWDPQPPTLVWVRRQAN